MQNTNVNGKHKAPFALRIIKGMGRRFAILVLKIAQIDLNKRAGELREADIEKISDIMMRPIGKYYLLPQANTPYLYRIRHPQVVPQQTEMPQGRHLLQAHCQHGRHPSP